MNVIRYSIKLMNKTTVEIDLTEHFGNKHAWNTLSVG